MGMDSPAENGVRTQRVANMEPGHRDVLNEVEYRVNTQRYTPTCCAAAVAQRVEYKADDSVGSNPIRASKVFSAGWIT